MKNERMQLQLLVQHIVTVNSVRPSVFFLYLICCFAGALWGFLYKPDITNVPGYSNLTQWGQSHQGISLSLCVCWSDIVRVLHVVACRWDGNLGGPAGDSG